MSGPTLRHIANLWTLMAHPSADGEWTLREKIGAIKAAGFDGVCWAGSPELDAECRRLGLIFVGGMASGKIDAFPGLLADLKRFGAHHVNVQLGADDTTAADALAMAVSLMEVGEKLGLEPAIETHRGTCTETPEKTYALIDAYRAQTGRDLRLSIDLSHFAVVKHLTPDQFAARLIVRPELIQRAQQFHLRPFNGHHTQVPVTDGRGGLTAEFKAWLPFAEALLRCWLAGNATSDREIFICPEMGPVVAGGYNLSVLPGSWEDAKVLRVEIERLWRRVASEEGSRRLWAHAVTKRK